MTERADRWPRWMRRDTAAEYLEVSVGTLDTLVREGTVPGPVRLRNRMVRWDREQIDAALLDRAAEPERWDFAA